MARKVKRGNRNAGRGDSNRGASSSKAAPKTATGAALGGASPDFGPTASVELIPAYLHFSALGAVILAMSGQTRHLDGIKVVVFLAAGAALFTILVWLFGRGFGRVPSRAILGGLWGYGLAMAVSTLNSEFSWAGAHELLFYWSAVGFFLGGFWTGSKPRARLHIWIGLTALLAVVNLVGFAQFNPKGNGHTLLAWLYNALYGDVPPALQPERWQAILFTFKQTGHDQLMSTAFNRDFYAAQCLLYAPFAIALSLAKVRTPLRVFGGIVAVASIVSILFCRSKGEYLAGAVEGVVLAILVLGAAAGKSDRTRTLRRMAIGSGVALLMVGLGAIAMRHSLFSSRIISVSESFASRRIIYSGAIDIFKEFPWLGGGPGTFPIYFPLFRSPDYFLNGISNVTNYSHNMVLDLLSETGIVGVAMFLAILAPIALGTARAVRGVSARLDRTSYLFMVACICGLVGIVGSNMTSVSLRWPIGASGFWSVLGMLAGVCEAARGRASNGEHASGRSERSPRDDSGERMILVQWTMFAATLAVFFCSVWRANTYWHSRRAYNEGVVRVEPNRAIVEAIAKGRAKLPPEQYQALAQELVEGALHLEESIAIDPVFISAYYKLGSAESLLAQIDGARAVEHLKSSLTAYRALIEFSPDYAEVHYNLGIINYQLSRRERSRAKALRSASDLAGGNLASNQADRYFEVALNEFERMAELSDREGVLTALAERYVEAGRLREAIALYERATRLYPDRAKLLRRFHDLSLSEAMREAAAEATAEGTGDATGDGDYEAAVRHAWAYWEAGGRNERTIRRGLEAATKAVAGHEPGPTSGAAPSVEREALLSALARSAEVPEDVRLKASVEKARVLR